MENTLSFFKINDIEMLCKNQNNLLVVLLATLSPESVWNFFSMNALPFGHGIDLLMLVVTLLEPEYSECAKIVREKLSQVC